MSEMKQRYQWQWDDPKAGAFGFLFKAGQKFVSKRNGLMYQVSGIEDCEKAIDEGVSDKAPPVIHVICEDTDEPGEIKAPLFMENYVQWPSPEGTLFRGLYRKYIVSRTDGKSIPPEADYFLLRLDEDDDWGKACRMALAYFAAQVQPKFPNLARDLYARIEKYGGCG